MTKDPAPLRIGGVPYSVGAPLIAGLDERGDIDLERRSPTELIRLLRAGNLEVALASSVEAFRRPGYRAMRWLGIACCGEVRSVRLFLRTDPAEVCSLALDQSSESSAALARILLERRYGAQLASTMVIEPTLDPDLVDADAVLLIGDAGLSAAAGRRRVLDLGEEWGAYKRLPFVFALWLMRTDAARAERAARCLHEAWARGRGIDDGTGGSIHYELGPEHLEGLEAFHTEAEELGLCPKGVEPEWI